MKFLSLLLTLLVFICGINSQAEDMQDYITVRTSRIQDKNLVQIETLARALTSQHRLSRHPNSCGDVLTFRGPADVQSAKNLHLWISGIAHEMAALNQDEKLKLRPIQLKLHDIKQKIMLLADRNSAYFDGKGVDSLSTAIFTETQLNPKDYFFFFGDYLNGKTGWMTAVVLVKLSSGEAVFVANTNDCF
jgi:hypothetical protein